MMMIMNKKSIQMSRNMQVNMYNPITKSSIFDLRFLPFPSGFRIRTYAVINKNSEIFNQFVKTEGNMITFTIDYKNFIFKDAFKDYFNTKLIDGQSYYVLVKIRYDNDYFKYKLCVDQYKGFHITPW